MSYSKILVPVAPGRGGEARRAVDVARSLLGADGSITVVTVLEDLPTYLSVEAVAMDPALREAQEESAREVVDELTAPDVRVVVRRGSATRTILHEAEEGGHDCIVVASSQPGWAHLVLGSTAAGLVRHARCSVHVLREPRDAPR